jgi:hypothetical protein
MTRFHVRKSRLALVPALLAFGWAAAGSPEVRLAPQEWQQVRAALAWPDEAVPIHDVHAALLAGAPSRLLQVEVASATLARTDDYRTWMRALCSNETGAWKCEPPEDMVQLAGGGAVVLGAQASPEDVVRLARMLGHHPGYAAERELLSVRATGTSYVVNYRLGACEHLVRLRAEGGMFLMDPYDREVRACR